MTTGTYDRGLLYQISDPAFGSGNGPYVGIRSKRVWSGVNYPPGHPYYRPVTSRGIKKEYRPPTRPLPRDQTPHPFSVNGFRMLSGRGPGVTYPAFFQYPKYLGVAPSTDFNTVMGADPWSSNDDIALYGKLREEIVGSDFDLGVFIAETPKAFQMIGNTAIRLAKAYNHARKGNFVKASKLLTAGTGIQNRTAGSWLELQYGWLPLLSDISGGMAYVHRQLSAPVFRIAVTRRCAGYKPSLVCWSGSISSTPAKIFYKNSQAFRYKRLMALLKPTGTMPILPLDPLTVAWEVLPFSFVADWFIPIGNYLSALALSRTLTGTFVTSSVWRGRGMSPTQFQCLVPGSSCFSGASVTAEFWQFSRSVATNLSVPLPSMKGLEKTASVKHCLNGLALIQQTFRH